MNKLLGFIFLLILFSCNYEKGLDTVQISGIVRFANNEYIFLEKQTPEGYLRIDSARIDSERRFTLELPKGIQEIYRINFFGLQKVNIVAAREDLEIEADGINPDGYFFGKGSPEMDVISKVNQLVKNYNTSEQIIKQKMLSAQTYKDSVAFFNLNDSLQNLNNIFIGKMKEFIRNEKGSLTGLMLLKDHFQIEPYLDFYDEQIKFVLENSGDHWQLKELETNYLKIRKVSVGAIAPDFQLPDPKGNEVNLSDFRGKYLFLDFWASWCQPCRMENPDYVNVYDRFKGDQFEIFGVSFDRKKENWLKAIDYDGLEWIHVSDLLYFDSEMIDLYNITSVPTTFLLDPEGVIIAKNIRSQELENMLEERLQAAQ